MPAKQFIRSVVRRLARSGLGPRTRTVSDEQGREWDVSVEEGAIVARRDGRTRVYYGRVGVTELPATDELEEIIRSHDWGRRIQDEDGTAWLVTSTGRRGVATSRLPGLPSYGLDFNEITGEGQHRYPTAEFEHPEAYSNEELIRLLRELREAGDRLRGEVEE